MTDFPAAHSMDTTWFAIDRDGHVAVFDSGEAGAVPTEVAHGGGVGYDEAEALVQLPDRGALVDLLGLRSMLPPGHDHATLDVRPYQVTAFVRDPAAIEDLVRRMNARVYPATTGSALVFTHPDPASFAELHHGACVMCVRTFTITRHATYGLYDYTHSNRFENWIAGPYARLAVPVKPITADELPAVVLDAAIRFAGRFADHHELQPAEHWPSTAYSAAWVATDHKTRRDFDTGEIVTDDDD